MAVKNTNAKTEINVLGSDSLLDEVKEVISKVSRRYNKIKIDESNLDIAGAKAQIAGVVSGAENKNADAMDLIDLNNLEQRLDAIYQSTSRYNKGDKTIEKVLYNLLTVKNAKQKLQEIQEIRDRIEAYTAEGLEGDAQTIEDFEKLKNAQQDFDLMENAESEKIVIYGQRDENSVFDFWKYNKDTKRKEFITAKEQTEMERGFLEKRKECSKALEKEVKEVLGVSVSDAVQNQTQKVHKYNFGGGLVAMAPGKKMEQIYNLSVGGDAEVETYSNNSAIHIASVSANVLREFELQGQIIEGLGSKLEEIDQKMSKQKFPDDVKYREVVAAQLKFAKEEKEKLKGYIAQLDQKLSEINKNKTAHKDIASNQADIMNKFVECCRIKQKNKYSSAQISNIVDSEMASLYEQMQEKMGDVKGQSAKKTDSELFKITTLPKNSHELVEDPAQVLRLMQIAMDGQVGGKKLTYEQEGQLSGILSVCVRELNLNEKNKNNSNQNNAELDENQIQQTQE
jgi:hypothetical protein